MRCWTGRELLEQEFPQSFLFAPIIPREGIVLLHGKRSTGKSHLALSLALVFLWKGRLFGRYPSTAKDGERVVYVQADMSPQLQQKRLEHASTYIPEPLLGQLYFLFPLGLDITYLSEESELTKHILEVSPSLIIWDTLAKVFRGDTNQDFSSAIVYGKVRHFFPAATHIFVHHDKKKIPEQEKLDPAETFRGSGAWLDNADTGLHLVEISERRVLSFTKLRSCEEQYPVDLFLHKESLLMFTVLTRSLAYEVRDRFSDPLEVMKRSLVGHPAYREKVLREYSE